MGRGIEIEGVRARPGGRVKLKFTPVGLAVTPENTPRRLDRWFGAGPMLFALGTLLLQLWPLTLLMPPAPTPETALPAAAPALLALLYLLLGGLYHGRHEVIGTALLWVLCYLLVIALPVLLVLLLSRRFRRRIFGRRGGEEGEGGSTKRPAGLVPTEHMVRGRVLREPGTAMVTVDFTDGSSVSYTAEGEDGERLVGEFHRLLGERLVAEQAPSGR